MPTGDILTLVRTVLATFEVQTLAALVLVDVVSGVAAAVRTRTFELKKVADFMGCTVLPYLVTYGAVRLATLALPEWEPVALGVFALISTALLGSIVANLREVFGKDIQLPPLPPHG